MVRWSSSRRPSSSPPQPPPPPPPPLPPSSPLRAAAAAGAARAAWGCGCAASGSWAVTWTTQLRRPRCGYALRVLSTASSRRPQRTHGTTAPPVRRAPTRCLRARWQRCCRSTGGRRRTHSRPRRWSRRSPSPTSGCATRQARRARSSEPCLTARSRPSRRPPRLRPQSSPAPRLSRPPARPRGRRRSRRPRCTSSARWCPQRRARHGRGCGRGRYARGVSTSSPRPVAAAPKAVAAAPRVSSRPCGSAARLWRCASRSRATVRRRKAPSGPRRIRGRRRRRRRSRQAGTRATGSTCGWWRHCCSCAGSTATPRPRPSSTTTCSVPHGPRCRGHSCSSTG